MDLRLHGESLIGKLVLNVFDYYFLFQFAAPAMAAAITPAVLLRCYGWPTVRKDLEVRASSVELAKEMATHAPNAWRGDTLLCNHVWNVVSVHPA
jgi:hypothetical protein